MEDSVRVQREATGRVESLRQRRELDLRQAMANRRQSGMRDYKPPVGPRPPDSTGSRRIASEAVKSQAPQSRPLLPHPTSEPFLGLSSRRVDSAPNLIKTPSISHPQHNSNGTQSTTISSNSPISTHTMRIRPIDNKSENRRPNASNTRLTGKSMEHDYRQDGEPPKPATQPPLRQINTGSKAARLSKVAAPVSRPSPFLTRHEKLLLDPYDPPGASGPPGSAHFGRVARNRKGRLSPALALFQGIDLLRKAHAANNVGYHDDARTRLWERYVLSDQEVEAVYLAFKNPGSFPEVVNPADDDQREAFIDLAKDAGLFPFTRPRTLSPTDRFAWRRWAESHGGAVIASREAACQAIVSEALIDANGQGDDGFPRNHNAVPNPDRPGLTEKPPSSSQASPEPEERHSTGRSLSSHSSYCSLGPASQSAAALPMKKPSETKSFTTVHRLEGASEEMVPPVPALPKSFESTSTMDEPFFESFEAQPAASATHETDTRQKKTLSMAAPPASLERPQLSPDSRFRRRFTMDPRTAQIDSSNTPRANRQTSQPYRLPPLNVVPLSEQTSERVQSMARTQGHGETAKTPPPLFRTVHPPSTPMTASKASFSQFDFRHATSQPAMPQTQANGSQGRQLSIATQDQSPKNLPRALANGGMANGGMANGGMANGGMAKGGMANGGMATQQVNNTSAYGEAGKALKTIASAVNKPFATRSAATTPPGSTPNHPWRGRSRPTSRADERQGVTAAELTEPPKAPTPSSKRRMSLRFRRTSSKTPNGSSRTENLDATVDATSMPPPRLSVSKVSTEPPKSSSSFASFRDGGETSSKPPTAADRKDFNRTTDSKVFSEKPFAKPLHMVSSQRSLSSQSARSVDSDTLAADDEMKRLASKKREFEISARELDALQRRANPSAGISPGQASRTAKLNIYETGEIVDFPEVYFCGHRDTRKVVGDAAHRADNFGFDDERGDYKIVASDHLAYRYEVVDILGKGSFGQVVRCIDHKHGKLVAVKIIRNKKRFHQQALVECNILQKLREWDPQGRHCMINFTESFYFRSHLCIATELLGMNLYEFIKAHEFRGFSLKLIRRFTKQMLSCLSLLQGQKVIHCDLKPENILLAHPLQSAIKTIDFGSSCFENEKVYTYIQSRFYRSPEVILGMDYGMPIDMWSMGCILAELYTGYPIFPGENEQEQLACIMEVFGPPERHLIEKSSRKKVFFDSAGKPRATVSSKGKRRRPSSKTLQQAIKCDDEAFLDFLTKCLKWDPDKRLKPNDALAHDFITGAKSRGRTSMAPSPIKRPLTSGPTFAGSPSRSRPLPDPPSAASIRRAATGAATNAAATASNSPLKMNLQTRRQSIMNVTTNGMKRNSNGIAMGASGLPRSVPARSDMASAAALASVRNR